MALSASAGSWVPWSPGVPHLRPDPDEGPAAAPSDTQVVARPVDIPSSSSPSGTPRGSRSCKGKGWQGRIQTQALWLHRRNKALTSWKKEQRNFGEGQTVEEVGAPYAKVTSCVTWGELHCLSGPVCLFVAEQPTSPLGFKTSSEERGRQGQRSHRPLTILRACRPARDH